MSTVNKRKEMNNIVNDDDDDFFVTQNSWDVSVQISDDIDSKHNRERKMNHGFFK